MYFILLVIACKFICCTSVYATSIITQHIRIGFNFWKSWFIILEHAKILTINILHSLRSPYKKRKQREELI